MHKVKRTERGWPGHFICADQCIFRRNTLLECGDTRIVVSTVGGMRDSNDTYTGIAGHFAETLCFHAERVSGLYWDADVSRQLSVGCGRTGEGCDVDSDMLANNAHEATVAELTKLLKAGEVL